MEKGCTQRVINTLEVEKAMAKIISGKDAGIHGITPEMVKYLQLYC